MVLTSASEIVIPVRLKWQDGYPARARICNNRQVSLVCQGKVSVVYPTPPKRSLPEAAGDALFTLDRKYENL